MRVLTPWQRLAIGCISAVILWAIGIAGYMAIEGFSFLDALYQTITAVTTAGFGEINPLGSAGRVFTIVIIILGVMIILYVLTAVMQIAVEGELESILGARRMKSKIEALKDHYILCGFGRVGTEIVREFTARGAPFVIVESNPESIGRAQAGGHLLVEGDATSDAVLREAGIDRARGLLAASDSDAGNTFVVLTAKALRPDLYVVSRATRPESQPPMRRAGADRAISPYAIAGRRMALSALQPLVVEFIDVLARGRQEEQILAEIDISPESGLGGRTIEDVMQSCREVVVLGVQRATGAIQVGPRGDTALEVGDRLIVL
ncbi:MAG: potassium channel protein, partial [Dehalococcoidia bacterium]